MTLILCHVTFNCRLIGPLQEKLLGHLGVVLYEYLGEEYPEVLGSILGGLKVKRKNARIICVHFVVELHVKFFKGRFKGVKNIYF